MAAPFKIEWRRRGESAVAGVTLESCRAVNPRARSDLEAGRRAG